MRNIFPTNSYKNRREHQRKTKLVEISNVFIKNLEAQNAAAPKFPHFKNQKPAAGGAPIAK